MYKRQALLKEYVAITLGTLIGAAAVYFFLIPSHVTVGSTSGLVVVLANFLPFRISVMTFALNAVLLILGFLTIGRAFGGKTIYTSILRPFFRGVLEELFPNQQSLTGDSFLDGYKRQVEDSGIFGKVVPERFGVYFGSGIGGLITMSNEMQKLLEKGPKRVSPFFIPMMIANMAAGNIAIRFEAKGPCLPVTTACATSTNEVGEAFHAIRTGSALSLLPI